MSRTSPEYLHPIGSTFQMAEEKKISLKNYIYLFISGTFHISPESAKQCHHSLRKGPCGVEFWKEA